ncbi:hypothetical protein [Spiroplasma clarkii]
MEKKQFEFYEPSELEQKLKEQRLLPQLDQVQIQKKQLENYMNQEWMLYV